MKKIFALLIAAASLGLKAQDAPQGCDPAHFKTLDIYLQTYGNNPPDRDDIERFISLNHRLCDRIIRGEMSEDDAGEIYRREVKALADRVTERDLELRRQAGLLGAG
jgi:hypothetical protein